MFDGLKSYYTDYEGVNAMHPHQERVVAEKKELDEKLEKLSNFIFKGDLFGTLDNKEQDRLRRQYTFMHGYSDVLGERITAF